MNDAVKALADDWQEKSDRLNNLSATTPALAQEIVALQQDMRRILAELSYHAPSDLEGAILMMDAVMAYADHAVLTESPEALAILRQVRNFLADIAAG